MAQSTYTVPLWMVKDWCSLPLACTKHWKEPSHLPMWQESKTTMRICFLLGSQRDVVYLGWPKAPSSMNPNAGGGDLSQWVQLYTWAQINVGYLTPYFFQCGAFLDPSKESGRCSGSHDIMHDEGKSVYGQVSKLPGKVLTKSCANRGQ